MFLMRFLFHGLPSASALIRPLICVLYNCQELLEGFLYVSYLCYFNIFFVSHEPYQTSITEATSTPFGLSQRLFCVLTVWQPVNLICRHTLWLKIEFFHEHLHSFHMSCL